MSGGPSKASTAPRRAGAEQASSKRRASQTAKAEGQRKPEGRGGATQSKAGRPSKVLHPDAYQSAPSPNRASAQLLATNWRGEQGMPKENAAASAKEDTMKIPEPARRSLKASLVAGMVGLTMAACAKETPRKKEEAAVTDPTAANYRAPPLPTGKVTLKDALGNSHALDVEIASNDNARARGMMWRDELPEGKGMLFAFPRDEPHSFWMKNTLIPLDIVYLDHSGKVTGIVKSAEPRSLQAVGPDTPSRYVLEVPGGWTDKYSVQTGSTATFELPANLQVE
jgi:uncharacterized membrane protein (UPF0127 family)